MEILKFEDQKDNLFSILQNQKIFNQLIIELKRSKFLKFKECLSNKDYAGAMAEMKDSRWYNQTTNRANRLIAKMQKSITVDV